MPLEEGKAFFDTKINSSCVPNGQFCPLGPGPHGQKLRKSEENMKDSKGITLVSLVVTIIILIILAGISLNMVLLRKPNKQGKIFFWQEKQRQFN